MATNWPRIPAFDSDDEIDVRLPERWRVDQIENLYDQLPIGKRFDQKCSAQHGSVPVIDQSADGVIGWHDEQPGILASTDTPVVTFANHTCEMRLMRRPFSVIQNVFPLVGKKGTCDTRFLYYGTKGRVNFEEYKGHYPDFRRKWVLVPPLPEQRAIAHILGSLDDKIDLNRRMNETLEAMARALFKSWFVDFDPVCAKTEGRDPGLPEPIADLFPNRFVDSEFGAIPEGWEVGILGDVAEHPRRGVQPDKIKSDTPYIALEHMPRRCIALTAWGAADGLESNKFAFKRGEILFGKLRPYFHKVGVAPVDGICSTDIVVLAPKGRRWFGFVLGHVSSVEFVEYTNAGSTGTKMPRTCWADMARYEVVLPPEPVAGAFTKLVQPLIDRIIASIYESRTIAAVRDVVLPKLISGEVRVKGPKWIVMRATS